MDQQFSTIDDLREGIVLLIDKEIGWTSFDVVNKIKGKLKYAFKEKLKVGHAGTLDPLASGLVVVGIGKATKLMHGLLGMQKEYVATIRLGETTPSFDLETEVDEVKAVPQFLEGQLKDILEKFRGKQMQVPPIYSAKKFGGKRAYEFARKGKSIDLAPVEIEIEDIELIKWAHPELSFRVITSKGTYIRALANDIGKTCGCGAYLKSLRRTSIGNLNVDDAMAINEFDNMVNSLKQN